MQIMSAYMGYAYLYPFFISGYFRTRVRQSRSLGNGKRIHIGPEHDGWSFSILHNAHYTSHPDTR